MARMHSRKHGKSGSHKPVRKLEHEWLIYDKEEIEKLIIKLAKEGNSNAKIGLILRDQYGIPDVRSFKIRISKITEKEIKKPVPEDMFNLMKKAVALHKHLENNKKDKKAIHGLELVESKIRRLGKYYSRKGKLPKDWKYDIEEAKLLVK
jgi:small subunit ribosomal protein S15